MKVHGTCHLECDITFTIDVALILLIGIGNMAYVSLAIYWCECYSTQLGYYDISHIILYHMIVICWHADKLWYTRYNMTCT